MTQAFEAPHGTRVLGWYDPEEPASCWEGEDPPKDPPKKVRERLLPVLGDALHAGEADPATLPEDDREALEIYATRRASIVHELEDTIAEALRRILGLRIRLHDIDRGLEPVVAPILERLYPEGAPTRSERAANGAALGMRKIKGRTRIVDEVAALMEAAEKYPGAIRRPPPELRVSELPDECPGIERDGPSHVPFFSPPGSREVHRFGETRRPDLSRLAQVLDDVRRGKDNTTNPSSEESDS